MCQLRLEFEEKTEAPRITIWLTEYYLELFGWTESDTLNYYLAE